MLDQLQRRLPWTKTVYSRGARDILQSRSDLLANLVFRHFHRHPVLKFARLVNRYLHKRLPSGLELSISDVRILCIDPDRRVAKLVRKERLELSRVAPLEPKSSASTSSATFARPAGPASGRRAQSTTPTEIYARITTGRLLVRHHRQPRVGGGSGTRPMHYTLVTGRRNPLIRARDEKPPRGRVAILLANCGIGFAPLTFARAEPGARRDVVIPGDFNHLTGGLHS